MFGTPSDYFREVRERMKDFQTLQGDFFVYSDIFSEGRPAYWSGYFTTRPYWKILDRELEANVRSAEILYTWALNRARQVKIKQLSTPSIPCLFLLAGIKQHGQAFGTRLRETHKSPQTSWPVPAPRCHHRDGQIVRYA